jgi:hypothetical protein
MAERLDRLMARRFNRGRLGSLAARRHDGQTLNGLTVDGSTAQQHSMGKGLIA